MNQRVTKSLARISRGNKAEDPQRKLYQRVELIFDKPNRWRKENKKKENLWYRDQKKKKTGYIFGFTFDIIYEQKLFQDAKFWVNFFFFFPPSFLYKIPKPKSSLESLERL